MGRAMRSILRFLFRSDAATAVEYSVMLALILLSLLLAIGAVGQKSGGLWGGVASSIEENHR